MNYIKLMAGSVKNQAMPRQMLKLVIYAAMNRIYSSRDIRKACKRDINFMYLLEGMPAPELYKFNGQEFKMNVKSTETIDLEWGGKLVFVNSVVVVLLILVSCRLF